MRDPIVSESNDCRRSLTPELVSSPAGVLMPPPTRANTLSRAGSHIKARKIAVVELRRNAKENPVLPVQDRSKTLRRTNRTLTIAQYLGRCRTVIRSHSMSFLEIDLNCAVF